ncbi:hypothetical protein [Jannaschia rubra]|uniref:Uncharacterized protein n=1 Tax=Jannaschia rubra TaxID=282197 RepID=A0A0M6XNT7_9RHOB|nr:hypothetical protein [Jannaschia rubra]CTQ31861.1 hypothetical protein JAN5088_00620 [Jannaschia rubra]SFG52023.1 hypothetical protein SAMN04488517_1063 [Jannaschia rubra]
MTVAEASIMPDRLDLSGKDVVILAGGVWRRGSMQAIHAYTDAASVHLKRPAVDASTDLGTVTALLASPIQM